MSQLLVPGKQSTWVQISPKTIPNWLRWSTYNHPYPAPSSKQLRRTGLTIVRARGVWISSEASNITYEKIGVAIVTAHSHATRHIDDVPWQYEVSNVILDAEGTPRLGALTITPRHDGRTLIRPAPYRSDFVPNVRLVSVHGRLDVVPA